MLARSRSGSKDAGADYRRPGGNLSEQKLLSHPCGPWSENPNPRRPCRSCPSHARLPAPQFRIVQRKLDGSLLDEQTNHWEAGEQAPATSEPGYLHETPLSPLAHDLVRPGRGFEERWCEEVASSHSWSSACCAVWWRDRRPAPASVSRNMQHAGRNNHTNWPCYAARAEDTFGSSPLSTT